MCAAKATQKGRKKECAPDHLAEEERFVHCGCLHVEQAGIEGEEESSDDSSRGAEPIPREAPKAGDAENVAGHGGNGARDSVLPPFHAGGEGHHEQVRERQPDGADLADPGVKRVEDAAGDMQVRYGVSVEEKEVAREAVAEGQDGKQRGDHGGKDRFVAERANGVDGRLVARDDSVLRATAIISSRHLSPNSWFDSCISGSIRID